MLPCRVMQCGCSHLQVHSWRCGMRCATPSPLGGWWTVVLIHICACTVSTDSCAAALQAHVVLVAWWPARLMRAAVLSFPRRLAQQAVVAASGSSGLSSVPECLRRYEVAYVQVGALSGHAYCTGV